MFLFADGFDPEGRPAWQYEVFVDGKKARYCVAADDEAGYALCCKVDDDGVLVKTQDGEGIEKVELRGKVELRLREGNF